MIRVATAGWSYPDWEGRVYPPRQATSVHPLRVLARCLDGVEVNSTFYARTREEVVARWSEEVEEGSRFHFIAKLHQSLTHGPIPDSKEPWHEEVLSLKLALRPLLRRKILDGVLVQFPQTFHYGPAEVRRLGKIAALLDPLPRVLEVRHRSWFERPALDSIRGLGYSLAHIDLPDAWDHPPKRFTPTGPIGYLRLHGRNSETWFTSGVGRDARYDYLYTPHEIGELAHAADSIAREVDQTWVVTNNHFEGQAMANAIELKWLLGGREPVPAPMLLVEAFPRLAPLSVPFGQVGLFGNES